MTSSTNSAIDWDLYIAEKAKRMRDAVMAEILHDRWPAGLPYLPERYRAMSLGNFLSAHLDSEARQRQVNRCNHAFQQVMEGRSVTLLGEPGCGKTHLAVGLWKRWVAQRISCGAMWRPRQGDPEYMAPELRIHPIGAYFIPACEFIRELKASFDDHGDPDEILDRYTNVSLLLLDDIGSENMTGWSREQMFLLLDRRYRESRQTIITSNVTKDQLGIKIDDRLASRLAEMSYMVQLENIDYRLIKGKG